MVRGGGGKGGGGSFPEIRMRGEEGKLQLPQMEAAAMQYFHLELEKQKLQTKQ